MSKQIHVIWDDHDYGKNDGGGSYRFKEYAQNLYIDFWDIPANDPRANREGIYYQQLQNINGHLYFAVVDSICLLYLLWDH